MLRSALSLDRLRKLMSCLALLRFFMLPLLLEALLLSLPSLLSLLLLQPLLLQALLLSLPRFRSLLLRFTLSSQLSLLDPRLLCSLPLLFNSSFFFDFSSALALQLPLLLRLLLRRFLIRLLPPRGGFEGLNTCVVWSSGATHAALGGSRPKACLGRRRWCLSLVLRLVQRRWSLV